MLLPVTTLQKYILYIHNKAITPISCKALSASRQEAVDSHHLLVTGSQTCWTRTYGFCQKRTIEHWLIPRADSTIGLISFSPESRVGEQTFSPPPTTVDGKKSTVPQTVAGRVNDSNGSTRLDGNMLTGGVWWTVRALMNSRKGKRIQRCGEVKRSRFKRGEPGKTLGARSRSIIVRQAFGQVLGGGFFFFPGISDRATPSLETGWTRLMAGSEYCRDKVEEHWVAEQVSLVWRWMMGIDQLIKPMRLDLIREAPLLTPLVTTSNTYSVYDISIRGLGA